MAILTSQCYIRFKTKEAIWNPINLRENEIKNKLVRFTKEKNFPEKICHCYKKC